MRERIIIVGAGECGTRAAFALRNRGWEGALTLIGDEALPAYERPPLSKRALLSMEWGPTFPFSSSDYHAAEIDLQLGTRVGGISTRDRRVDLENGDSLLYDALLLATGSRPRVLGVDPHNVALYLYTHNEVARLRHALRPGRTVLVIGAGFIGLEVASAACLLGCDVLIVESGSMALARAVPAVVAQSIVALHQAHGVRFAWNTTVESLEPADALGASVRLSTGQSMNVDAVFVGIGSEPAIDLAASADIVVDNGFRCDSAFRTSAEGVFAAGDCASVPHSLFEGTRVRLESWQNAHTQADAAAASMLGSITAATSVPTFWSDQFDRTLRQSGLSTFAHSTVERTSTNGDVLHFGLDQNHRVVSASTFGHERFIAKEMLWATKLIERRIQPRVELLADATVPLKRHFDTPEGSQ